jgi:hypothetical protein
MGQAGVPDLDVYGVPLIVNPIADPRSMLAVPDDVLALDSRVHWEKFKVARPR